MKNRCIIFLTLIIITLTGFLYFPQTGGAGTSLSLEKTEYLRIHIRADSNAEADQRVKYAVRDSVVEVLTPLVKNCASKSQATEILRENLLLVVQAAEKTLRSAGFEYGARASLRNERFPTRVYGSLTLPEGAYDALVVELGSGAGDNWWCVVYPPLCFTGGAAVAGDVVYKSKLAELFAVWRGQD